jgi:hypothetical protein
MPFPFDYIKGNLPAADKEGSVTRAILRTDRQEGPSKSAKL